jgi:hypothetical protein
MKVTCYGDAQLNNRRKFRKEAANGPPVSGFYEVSSLA